ncbi:DUF4393 domain-containing protein [Weissella minor]|uniref:DUF4393 domain-containing protein n=1 Tax=Weissella minor TaxID=1620 RepID=UPI003AF25594
MDPDKLVDATKSVSNATAAGINFLDKIEETNIGKNIGYAINGLFLTAFGNLVENGLVQQSKVDTIVQATTKNIEQIPSEKQTLDNKMMILKAFEELRYQIDNDDIKNMFINLISNSFNSDYNDDLSPLFAQILGNMSHKTAVFLDEWQQIPTEASPYTNIVKNNPDGSQQRMHQSIVAYWDGISRPYDDSVNDPTEGILVREVPSEISELEYFGLIKIHEHRAPTNADDMYKAISNHYKANRKYIMSFSLNDDNKTDKFSTNTSFSAGMIELSPLGKLFCNVIFNLHH